MAVADGNWEPHTFNVIDYYVNKAMVVMDVGCWAGPLSLYMAAKGAKVHALDPDPEAFQSLEKNISFNPSLDGQIVAHKNALGVRSGEHPLFARKGYGHSSSSLLHRIRDKMFTAKADVLTIDEFLKSAQIEKLDFIKIDIEGGEFELSEHIAHVVEKLEHPTILLSLHYSHLNESIYKSKGFGRRAALTLMKIEKYFGAYWNMNELLCGSVQINQLASEYKYLYTSAGQLVSKKTLARNFYQDEFSQLVLTNVEWIEPISSTDHYVNRHKSTSA